MLPDVLSVVARALGFVCALQAAGIALFLVLFEIETPEVRSGVRQLGWRFALAAVALVLVHYGLEPARMAGDLSGVWDSSLQKLAATSGTAVATAVRIAGLLLIILALHPRGRWGSGAGGSRGAGDSVPYSPRAEAWIGALLVATSFAATGHTAAAEHRWVLGGLLVVHLSVIEFWFGALLPLIFLTRRAPLAAAARALQRFSRLATLLVPLILVAGVGMAWLLIPSLQVFREPYGQLLLVKVAGFAALLGLASLNKWRLVPALEAGELGAALVLQRSAAGEYVLIVIVLAATAAMTSFFSPEA